MNVKGGNSQDRMNWTRRLFVRDALRGWLGLVVAPAIYAVTRAFGRSTSPDLARPRDIGADDALKAGSSMTLQYGTKRILVARALDGRLHAVHAVCSHMGCSISFEPARGNGELACNCHASRFTLRGEILSGPATRPLAEYRVETVGGRLILAEAAQAVRGR